VRGDDPALPAQLVTELRSIEPDLPGTATAMAQKTAFALLPLRLASAVLGAAGAVAMFLATTGIFGVIAYSVSRQVRDIAIRMALGAGRWQVRRMVVMRAYRLTLIGLAMGLVAAVFGARLLGGLLYGVGPGDPLAMVIVVVLFTCVSALAAYSPARRASSVAPAITLRQE
jgi:ABC-type antimicrobial peptide transport system permease subunit